MRYSKWLALAAAILLIVSAFTPWIIIEDRKIVVSGIDAAGTNFGKPAYLHFVFTFLYIVFVFTPRIWAKRINLAIAGINLAWALRNFIVIPACQAGDCPEKQTGIYLMALASLLMLVAALFPEIELPEKK